MTDREKLIEQLENEAIATDKGYVEIPLFMFSEIIALLKEQEAVKPVLDKQTGRIWLCGKCGSYVGFEDNDPHDPNEFDKHCRDCGTPVLWEGR